MGVTPTNVSRWAMGQRPCQGPARKLLELFAGLEVGGYTIQERTP